MVALWMEPLITKVMIVGGSTSILVGLVDVGVCCNLLVFLRDFIL